VGRHHFVSAGDCLFPRRQWNAVEVEQIAQVAYLVPSLFKRVAVPDGLQPKFSIERVGDRTQHLRRFFVDDAEQKRNVNACFFASFLASRLAALFFAVASRSNAAKAASKYQAA
jgi:hypothetical protein